MTVTDGQGGTTPVIVAVDVVAAADIDSDGDGLSDYMEISHYLTSPSHPDTDGDGLDDGTEVIDLAFNPLRNQFKFNPNIADLPELGIDIVTTPQISLIYTSGAVESTTESSEDATTDTHSDTTELSISVEVGYEAGPTGGASGSVTASASHSWTDEQAVEHREMYSTSIEESQDIEGGTLKVTVNVTNDGEQSFTIKNLLLTALIPSGVNSGELLPIANMELELGNVNSFPETTLGPGQSVIGWVYNADLDLGTTRQLLADSRGLIVQASSFEIADALGRSFNHNLTEVNAKTALIMIDYGYDRPIQSFRVSTNRDYYVEPSMYGITVAEAFETVDTFLDIPMTATDDILYASTGITPYADSVGTPIWPVSAINGVANQNTLANGSWKFITSAEVDGNAFRDIKLYADDVLALVYNRDVDSDGLGFREERLWGTSDEAADTDGDGLTDFEEVRGWPGTDMAGSDYYMSNPLIADTDGDGLDDHAEYANTVFGVRSAANPYLIDTDEDYLYDGEDPSPTVRDDDFWIKNLTATPIVASGYSVQLDWTALPAASQGSVSTFILLRHNITDGDIPPIPVPPVNPGEFPTWQGDADWTRLSMGVALTGDVATYLDAGTAADNDYLYAAYVQVDFNGNQRIVPNTSLQVPYNAGPVQVHIEEIWFSRVRDWDETNFWNWIGDRLEFYGTARVDTEDIGYVSRGGSINDILEGHIKDPWPTAKEVYRPKVSGSCIQVKFFLNDKDTHPRNDWSSDDEKDVEYTHCWDGVALGWDLGRFTRTVSMDSNDKGGEFSTLVITYTIDDPDSAIFVP